jgi:hypothetical protein
MIEVILVIYLELIASFGTLWLIHVLGLKRI